MNIIAFAGLAHSGKTEAVKALMNQPGVFRISFAKPMKDMLEVLGLTHDQLYGDKKTTPTHILCGRTPRHAMVTIGTEWGRNMIHPELWVRAVANYIEKIDRDYVEGEPTILIDDLRFESELRFLRDAKAQIFGIQRGELPKLPLWFEFWKPYPHISEQLPYRLKELGIPIIKNDGTIAELHEKVLSFVAR